MEVEEERGVQEGRVAADWAMMDVNENDAEEEIELHGGELADTTRPSNLRMSGRPLSKVSFFICNFWRKFENDFFSRV